jgi:Plasmid pRiA4b ORF-3-like protein
MKRTSDKHGKTKSAGAAIWTLKVKLVFGIHARGPWEATLEIDSSATLEDLHLAIQSAVQFDDDHMYMFYAARTHRSRDRTDFELEDGTLQDTTLAELFLLPPDRKLFYWFDFGDDWIFSVGRTRTAPQVAGKNRKYPRIVGTRGDTPVQYPSWD